MKTKHSKILLLVAVLFAVVVLSHAHMAQAAPNAETERPIADFISAQGTTSVFVPPVPDQLGWTPASGTPKPNFALFDYAGKANDWLVSQGLPSLGTTMEGTVKERLLSDGRARVEVKLHTKKALAWAMPLDSSPDFAHDPLSFGYRAQDLQAQPKLPPALGHSRLKVIFKNTAPGAPLPDLVDCLQFGHCPEGFKFILIRFKGTAKGTLHAAAGLGPEGTRGRLDVHQLGDGTTPDGFPIEKVELKRIGK